MPSPTGYISLVADPDRACRRYAGHRHGRASHFAAEHALASFRTPQTLQSPIVLHFALHQQSSGLSPEVIAALIAVPVGLVTVVVQWLGVRRVSNDTNKQLEQQSEHLDRTLAEQRDQLHRTLAEQRDQLDRTLAEHRARTLNERFATAADRLGADRPAAVRLAAVYAMRA